MHRFSRIGFLTIPLNGKGGRLDGFELTASAPGELLADWLSGFGASVSLSETDSSIKVQGQVSGGPASNDHPAAGIVEDGGERHAVLREARIRGARRLTLPLRLHR